MSSFPIFEFCSFIIINCSISLLNFDTLVKGEENEKEFLLFDLFDNFFSNCKNLFANSLTPKFEILFELLESSIFSFFSSF